MPAQSPVFARENAYSSASARTGGRVLSSVHLVLRRITGEEWDQTIAGFDGVCQEQTYVFAKNRWPDVGHEALLFYKGAELVGGVLIMVQSVPLKLSSIAVSKWGPIFKKSDRKDQADIYAAAIDALEGEYCERRRMMLSVLPRAHWGDGPSEEGHLRSRGYHAGFVLPFPNRYVVNLRLSDEEQKKSFGQKWRYHLNKSMKADLSFERAEAFRADEFDTLYQAMTDRKKFADHSAYDDTIADLMAMENDQLRPELFFVRHEGEIIAGAIIFKAGDSAVYLYGATNHKALPLRAGYFMHWHIIRWLRDNTQANWYDLGGTDGFQGLHQFKKGMVGDAGVIAPVPPVMTYASHFWPRLAGRAAFAARDGLGAVRRFIESRKPGHAKPDQNRD